MFNLNVQDFNEKDQELVQQLAYQLNPSIKNLDSTMSGGIEFDKNIKSDIIQLTDITSISKNITVRLKNVTNVNGVIVIAVYNQTEKNGNVSSCPYFQWVKGESGILMEKMLGLKDNCKYNVTILVI